ncbi:Sec-independent protein translocase subunit TatB [Psychromonas sp. RZ22]|uniref:Sec-independent protein translocase protein TatB n=1 Tax=Psychromonas algarum TaxID=2555643 RepID=UPI00106746EB|nr:Sec-independent protein translocase protein TatB [Psychromonas sp. RZ22]TEW56628.1 Sec-independent protein translocase subunit TatB [Psychromonas sp. RZ22]
MFDIGFWEIMLISVIGLVVLGPQRLPIAIRSVVKWINAAKSMINSVKSEISQELELHEMNENMIKASKKGVDALDPGLQASIDEMKNSVNELTRPYQKSTVDLMATPAKNKNTAQDLDENTSELTEPKTTVESPTPPVTPQGK